MNYAGKTEQPTNKGVHHMSDSTEGDHKRSLADCIEPSDPFELGRHRVRQLYNESSTVVSSVSSSRGSKRQAEDH